MDPSHIALIDVSCPASAFEKYECPSPIRFGFRVDDFAKVIKRADSNDSIELGLQDSMLNVKTAGKYARSYKLRLIESAAGASTPLPKLTFDSKLVMSPSILDKILSDIEVVSDKITIETTDNRQVICTTKGDSGEATITLDDMNGIENLHEISINKPSKATYSSEIMSKIVKAVGVSSEKVTGEFTSKMPLKLTFALRNTVKIEFYLAPRVED
jgi:proliferating cell nuclear antigen